MTTLLTINDLQFRYNEPGEKDVFKDVSLELKLGELVCIVGPSGCGKTTFLNLIAGFLKPTKGELLFHNSTFKRKQRIGYIFQTDALLPWRTVLGNVLLGQEINGIEDKPSRLPTNVIDDFLRVFNLKPDILSRYPNQLSNGMRQRIAIIQSLMCNPDILLLDEPFSSLDFYTKLRLENEFYSMVRRNDKAAILVTHDIDEAIAVGHRVIVMGNSPEGLVKEFNIDFGTADRSPEVVRGHGFFPQYHKAVWGELKERIKNGR